MGFLNNPIDEGPGVDYDELYSAWCEVAEYELELNAIQDAMDKYIALCKKDALEDKELWPNGQRPTMEYIKQVVGIIGNTGDDRLYIDDMQARVLELQEYVTKAKGRLDSLQTQVRIWQTCSANARKTLSIE